MPECDFCGSEVEDESHTVVNGRVILNDQFTCADCGYNDEELIEWAEEHQPNQVDEIKRRLED